MAHPLHLLATGVAGGVAAATVAVGSTTLTGDSVSPSFWIGVAIVSSIGLAVLAACKKWVENQVSKVVELPTKQEIFDAIEKGIRQASGYHAAVLEQVAGIRGEVHEMKEEFQHRLYDLGIRTSEIEMRHKTEDRINAGRHKTLRSEE